MTVSNTVDDIAADHTLHSGDRQHAHVLGNTVHSVNGYEVGVDDIVAAAGLGQCRHRIRTFGSPQHNQLVHLNHHHTDSIARLVAHTVPVVVHTVLVAVDIAAVVHTPFVAALAIVVAVVAVTK